MTPGIQQAQTSGQVAHSSMSKPESSNGVGVLAGVGMKVVQGHKRSSDYDVTDDMGVGISKAIGPESSFQSELSKSNMMVMPPMPAGGYNNN